jgi:hypothetical protein
MEDNPPPTDVKGLLERLKPVDNPNESETKISEFN